MTWRELSLNGRALYWATDFSKYLRYEMVLPSMIESLGTKLTRFAALYRDEGIAKAARHGCARALQRAVWLLEDRIVRRGIGGRTRKFVAAADLATESTNRHFANRYEATPTPLLLMWFIRGILPKDRSAWTFIDVGAGKGRAVAAAANQGFHRVLGIEFSADLCDEANRLLADHHLTQDGRVRVEQADATQFEIPSGPCLFYLFNPFQEEIVVRFLDHVHESYIRNPRPIRFVYLNPVHQSVFEARHELKQVTPDPVVARIFSLLSIWPVSAFAIARETNHDVKCNQDS